MNSNDMRLKKRFSLPGQAGFTLVELMIASTIGLIILVALGQLFVTSRATYVMEEGLARAQESGRYAMEFLAQDIRMAGYMGCHNASSGAGTITGGGATTECQDASGNTVSFCNMANPADESTRFAAEGIRGYAYIGSGGNDRGDWSPSLPVAFFADGEVKANTDVILIQYAQSTNTFITDGTGPSNANIKVPSGSTVADQIAAGDVLIISDCKSTDVFRATGNSDPSGGGGNSTIPHASNANLSSHLPHEYGPGSEILMLVSRVYYIADSATNQEPALMRKELEEIGSGGTISAGQELIQGIEDMRLIYGVDTDPPPLPPATTDKIANRYVLAHEVVDLNGPGTTNWDDVVSLRLGLLIRTPSTVDQQLDTNTYELVDGVTVDPVDDRRRRQVYRTTIELRNN
jgi:type IV pilus assembly protein PilW